MHVGDFQIFLVLCFLSTILFPQKSPKKYLKVSEKGFALAKFTFIVYNTCKGFPQKSYLNYFVIFANIFKYIFCFHGISVQKNTQKLLEAP